MENLSVVVAKTELHEFCCQREIKKKGKTYYHFIRRVMQGDLWNVVVFGTWEKVSWLGK